MGAKIVERTPTHILPVGKTAIRRLLRQKNTNYAPALTFRLGTQS